jgi:hypothetical protein
MAKLEAEEAAAIAPSCPAMIVALAAVPLLHVLFRDADFHDVETESVFHLISPEDEMDN